VKRETVNMMQEQFVDVLRDLHKIAVFLSLCLVFCCDSRVPIKVAASQNQHRPK
jgi:hypothetical protein